ncbi:hypothetical protein M3Y99_01265200 [Aphelenchoides fujianensis]|nr:hypothetical protein M3Y99_01265200 [Aphelenchoides fujianensis]
MWHRALDYGASPSGYSPASHNTSNFFSSSFSDCDIKMNESNFTHLQQMLHAFSFMPPGVPSPPSSAETTPQVRSKKPPKPVPPESKTEAYYERRKKNNQSAQKSRTERRRREAEKEQKLKHMEHEVTRLMRENQQLQYELHVRNYQLQALQQQQSTGMTSNENSAVDSARQQSAFPAGHSGLPLPFNGQLHNQQSGYD